MIKNIVFDLGGVLIDYKPERYLEHIGYSKEEIKLFTKIIFYGEEWDEYNSSKYSILETKQRLIQRYLEHINKINEIFNNIDFKYILFEIKDTAKYLKELNDRGYNIYILSDSSIESHNHNKQFNFFNYIKGGVYSFEIGTTKPNENNYKTLLEKYKLIPEETIFIDDKKCNVEVANNFGIHGIRFTVLDKLKKELEQYI